jgi:hypothetical protein
MRYQYGETTSPQSFVILLGDEDGGGIFLLVPYTTKAFILIGQDISTSGVPSARPTTKRTIRDFLFHSFHSDCFFLLVLFVLIEILFSFCSFRSD